jgi:hypothetical protein
MKSYPALLLLAMATVLLTSPATHAQVVGESVQRGIGIRYTQEYRYTSPFPRHSVDETRTRGFPEGSVAGDSEVTVVEFRGTVTVSFNGLDMHVRDEIAAVTGRKLDGSTKDMSHRYPGVREWWSNGKDVFFTSYGNGAEPEGRILNIYPRGGLIGDTILANILPAPLAAELGVESVLPEEPFPVDAPGMYPPTDRANSGFATELDPSEVEMLPAALRARSVRALRSSNPVPVGQEGAPHPTLVSFSDTVIDGETGWPIFFHARYAHRDGHSTQTVVLSRTEWWHGVGYDLPSERLTASDASAVSRFDALEPFADGADAEMLPGYCIATRLQPKSIIERSDRITVPPIPATTRVVDHR